MLNWAPVYPHYNARSVDDYAIYFETTSIYKPILWKLTIATIHYCLYYTYFLLCMSPTLCYVLFRKLSLHLWTTFGTWNSSESERHGLDNFGRFPLFLYITVSGRDLASQKCSICLRSGEFCAQDWLREFPVALFWLCCTDSYPAGSAVNSETLCLHQHSMHSAVRCATDRRRTSLWPTRPLMNHGRPTTCRLLVVSLPFNHFPKMLTRAR